MAPGTDTVLIAEPLDDPCARWLAERARVVHAARPAEPADEELAGADGLVVRTYTLVDAVLLERAPRLRVVGRAGVGLDNIDLVACRRRGVPVVYTPDANTQAVVEYVLAVMLDDLRPRVGISAADLDRFHELRRQKAGTQLDELTLGILGLGRIGRRLGRVADALGMRLLVNDLLPESELRAAASYPFQFVDKPTLFRRSDVLSVHVDGRPENRRLIGADLLDLLPASCLFINAARGMLVDHEALRAWALRVADRGGRAILDVHDPEPIPPACPMLGLPNVRLLPHIAARTHTALRNMCWVVRDVAAVLEGRPPQFPAGQR